jgi:hypothetical protein
MKMGNDVKASLEKLVYNAIISHLRIHETGGILEEILEKERGLKMMPFDEFPTCLKPKSLNNGSSGWRFIVFSQEEENIFYQVNQLPIMKYRKKGGKREKLNDLPMVIYSPKISPENQGESTKFIWIIEKTGYMYDRREIWPKINQIIIILKACHQLTMEDLKKKEPNFDTLLHNKQFFHHIQCLLLGGKGVRLPLFGEFILPEIDPFDYRDINASYFLDGQIILLDYFSSSDYSSRVVHASLGLIYFWYKDQGNKAFDHNFPTEDLYWQRMSRITKKILSSGAHFYVTKLTAYLSG